MIYFFVLGLGFTFATSTNRPVWALRPTLPWIEPVLLIPDPVFFGGAFAI